MSGGSLARIRPVMIGAHLEYHIRIFCHAQAFLVTSILRPCIIIDTSMDPSRPIEPRLLAIPGEVSALSVAGTPGSVIFFNAVASGPDCVAKPAVGQ